MRWRNLAPRVLLCPQQRWCAAFRGRRRVQGLQMAPTEEAGKPGGTVVRAVTGDPKSSVLTLSSPVLSACTGERCPETECQEHSPAGPHMSQTISGFEVLWSHWCPWWGPEHELFPRGFGAHGVSQGLGGLSLPALSNTDSRVFYSWFSRDLTVPWLKGQ